MKYILVKWMIACAVAIILIPVKAQETLITYTDNGRKADLHQPQTVDGMQGIIAAVNAESITEQSGLSEDNADDSDVETQAAGDDTDSAENEPQTSIHHR